MIKVTEIKEKKAATFIKLRFDNDIRHALVGVIKEEYQGDFDAFFNDCVTTALTEFYRANKENLDARIDKLAEQRNA